MATRKTETTTDEGSDGIEICVDASIKKTESDSTILGKHLRANSNTDESMI
eukprot:CAMPEP_0116872864 /NCGR_PEP_ID=MMETSP0463-20121206/3786_1 /TAXON_ID=181622 /ORGANISM="Strombidinopsis sp, Strain SopsisLIS2011" /LENGTH=50 /DNA_ID=CAMNT_0004513855 /DNA_START=920 /DNA_END=1072 /DNA_ORIENTATION=-